MARGRPALRMTHHRARILQEIIDSTEPVTFASLARRCGLYDYKSARRIVNDLKKMGAI